MAGFEEGSNETGGSMRETATMIAMLTIIVGVGAAWGLDQLTRDGGRPGRELQARMTALPRPANRQTDAPALNQATVDYTPVGSIPANLAQPVILDPCTGRQE